MPPVRRLSDLLVGDLPAGWAAAGFTVTGEHVTVGGVRVRLGGTAAGLGIIGWGFEPAWTAPIDGLPAVPGTSDRRTEGDPAAPPPGPADAIMAHPNGVVALDHVVVLSPDVDRTTAALARAGIEPRRTVVGARGDDAVRYRFFLLGTSVLELVGPAVASDDGPAGFTGLAFTTERIDELGDLAHPPRAAVQPGRRIATLRREVGLSVPVAFLTPRVRSGSTPPPGEDAGPTSGPART